MATADTTLSTLLLEELRDIYHAEKQLVKALPKLAKAATSPDLREALEGHLAETEEQVSRLERAFEMLDETPKTKVCEGMLGIVEEGAELIKENDKGAALDAGIIGAAQRSEHYEMATYGTIMAWAKALGHNDIAELLSSTLEEEKAADEKLSELAEAGLNEAATSGESTEMAGAGSGRGRGTSKKSSRSNGR
jgi:ferritin-like metal-binding protein YciE